jgi:hypothetical protein
MQKTTVTELFSQSIRKISQYPSHGCSRFPLHAVATVFSNALGLGCVPLVRRECVLALDAAMTRNELLQIENSCTDLFEESVRSFRARAAYGYVLFLVSTEYSYKMCLKQNGKKRNAAFIVKHLWFCEHADDQSKIMRSGRKVFNEETCI